MASIIVTCPLCKKQYSIPQQNLETLMKKPFKCQACSYSAPFKMVLDSQKKVRPHVPSHAPTKVIGVESIGAQIAPPARPAAPAAPAQPPKPVVSTPTAVSPAVVVVSTGERIPLAMGMNVLGRRSSDSTATVKVAPDGFMSRQHAYITVLTVNGQTHAQITPIKAEAAVFVNGNQIPQGQIATLREGDKIRLGATDIVFAE